MAIKDLDLPSEPAQVKATRKWKNHSIQKQLKEAQKEETGAPQEEKTPEIAQVIRTKNPKAGKVVRAQTRFANEIREMLNEHKRKNNEVLLKYLYALRAKKIAQLEEEKLRQAQQEPEP